MIRIRQIKIPIEKYNQETLKEKVSKKLNCKIQEITNIKINKLSIDARKKPNIYYIIEVDIDIRNEKKYINNKDILIAPNEKYIYPKVGNKTLKYKPIIVGSGPAGLFCAYILAELGYKPLILERGEKIEDRVKTVEQFWKTGKLNKDSNVQFGEGGAGTFSDGKLNTMSKDKEHRHKKVFEIFVENGANPEIMYHYQPHIGTDELRKIIISIRNKITALGGTFLYNSTLTNININENNISSVEINNQKIIKTNILVLAIGHSARDTIEMLLEKEINITPKPFAVGLRIQHQQK